jgi:hypothetical protein
VIVIAAARWLIRRARNRRKTAGREEPSYARTA